MHSLVADRSRKVGQRSPMFTANLQIWISVGRAPQVSIERPGTTGHPSNVLYSRIETQPKQLRFRAKNDQKRAKNDQKTTKYSHFSMFWSVYKRTFQQNHSYSMRTFLTCGDAFFKIG